MALVETSTFSEVNRGRLRPAAQALVAQRIRNFERRAAQSGRLSRRYATAAALSFAQQRLWVNGQLIIDRWFDQGPTEWTGTIALTAGQRVSIQMDYYENGGGAVARLLWSSPSQTRQVIPQTQLYPAP